MAVAREVNFGKCLVEGCDRPQVCKHMCAMHAARSRRNGHLNLVNRPKGAGGLTQAGYITICKAGIVKLEHAIVAGRSLKRALRGTEEIHHIDGDKSNNAPSNLVICPDRAYHMLLHQRSRALAACGNANWRKCCYCKNYDDPCQMYVRRKDAWHRACKQHRERDANAY